MTRYVRILLFLALPAIEGCQGQSDERSLKSVKIQKLETPSPGYQWKGTMRPMVAFEVKKTKNAQLLIGAYDYTLLTASDYVYVMQDATKENQVLQLSTQQDWQEAVTLPKIPNTISQDQNTATWKLGNRSLKIQAKPSQDSVLEAQIGEDSPIQLFDNSHTRNQGGETRAQVATTNCYQDVSDVVCLFTPGGVGNDILVLRVRGIQ